MFGIRPWEVERLRPSELEAMQDSLRAPEEDRPLSLAEEIEALPVFDEGSLPDPMGVAPASLQRLPAP